MPLKILCHDTEQNIDDFSDRPYFDLLNKLHRSDLNLVLEFDQYGLHLLSSNPEEKSIFLDFDAELNHHQNFFKKSSLYNELLARAVGIKPKKRPKVMDATAGFLGDTLMLLCMGVEVDAFERHPLAQLLCTEAISRSKLLPTLPFTFHGEDIENYLAIQSILPEVIYFDPMYEDPNRKTSPKKEMRLFREYIGSDHDAQAKALFLKDHCSDRLVIKRPIASVELIKNPSIVFRGKSTRYDVYLKVK